MTQPQADQSVDTPPAASDDAPVPSGTPEPAELNPNSEAARYRVQLREAEAARDAITERLTAYQRRECEAVVADLLDVPSDMWEVAQADVNDFYNDDGMVNEAEVRSAAGALVDQRPRLGKPVPPQRWQNAGQFIGKPLPEKTGWSEVIQGS